MKLKILLVAIIVVQFGFAQTNFGVKKSCISVEHENYLRSLNPNRETKEQFENILEQKIEEAKLSRTTASPNVVVTIPVVIHIIHNGDAVGSGENISDAQALSQITVLNQDFRRMMNTPGFNNNPVGADVEVQFCMAQRKPNGTATNGIDRVQQSVSQFTSIGATETMKANTIWDPTKYLNFWVVRFQEPFPGFQGGVLLGYGQFPSFSGLSDLGPNIDDANTDGVAMSFRAFGSSDIAAGNYYSGIDKGRTTTHELGHFFGLRHIWGDSNCGTDYCADTPTAHEENYGCPTVVNCNGNGNEMVENYMDYTNDACMNIFTQDQKTRILTVLANGARRNSLLTSNACQAPLSTSDFDINNSIQLFPNPTSGLVEFYNSSDYKILKVELLDINGRKIKEISLFDNQYQLDISECSKGVYLMKISTENGSVTKKIIKK